MNSMKKINAYKTNSFATQSREKIVVMLYQGAIRFLKESIVALENEDFKTKGEKLGRAIDIITELNASLDFEKGGEIAINLRRTYEFMLVHLTQASIKKDILMIEQVIDQLETMLEAWEQIAK